MNRKQKRTHMHNSRLARRADDSPLTLWNDNFPTGTTLHPTKGFRVRSQKSMYSELLYHSIKNDIQAWYKSVTRNAVAA